MPKPKQQYRLWVINGKIFQCKVGRSCMCWIIVWQLYGIVRMEP